MSVSAAHGYALAAAALAARAGNQRDEARAELDRLTAGVARVRELHHEVPNPWWDEGAQTTPTFGPTECAHDHQRWPCATARALDGEGA